MKVALYGAGMISGAHAAAARLLGMPIVAVASRSPERAAQRAAECDAVAVRYDELPAGADIVIVSTPPPQHAAPTLGLLARGAAVIVEKPLCATLAEADELVDAAGDRLLYAENLAYAPVVQALLDRVGELGPLTHLEVRTLQDRPTWGSFLTPAWGGGALFDLGVHPLAVALLIAAPAPVVSVRAQLATAPDHDTDEHAEVELTFSTGLIGRVVSSWRSGPGSTWDAQAASPTGVLRMEVGPTPELERDGKPVPLPAPSAAIAEVARLPQLARIEQLGYLGQLRAFADDLVAQRPPLMDASFGRTVLDIVCASYASVAFDGDAVGVPFEGPRDRTPWQLWRT